MGVVDNDLSRGESSSLKLERSENNLIAGNRIGLDIGIWAVDSHENTFWENTFEYCDNFPCYLDNCDRNTFLKNEITGRQWVGFSLSNADRNRFIQNSVVDHEGPRPGYGLYASDRNLLVKNEFSLWEDAEAVEAYEESGDSAGNRLVKNSWQE